MTTVASGTGREGLWVDNQMRRHRVRVMLAITVGYGMYYTCRLALSVVKKPLIDEGIFTITELGTLGSALFFGYAFGKFFNGFLADYVKPKLFFAAGLGLSAIANVAMGWSTVIAISMVLWALNGWFQGFGAPSSVVTLTNWFSNRERGRYYGIWSGGHFIGEGITFYVVAIIVAAMGWQFGFWFPGVMCLAAAAWTYAYMQNKPTTLGLPSVANWKNDQWEPEQPKKIRPSIWTVQRSIFKIPALWILALSSALMYVTRYAINSWGILYLQEARGYSLVGAGFFPQHPHDRGTRGGDRLWVHIRQVVRRASTAFKPVVRHHRGRGTCADIFRSGQRAGSLNWVFALRDWTEWFAYRDWRSICRGYRTESRGRRGDGVHRCVQLPRGRPSGEYQRPYD